MQSGLSPEQEAMFLRIYLPILLMAFIVSSYYGREKGIQKVKKLNAISKLQDKKVPLLEQGNYRHSHPPTLPLTPLLWKYYFCFRKLRVTRQKL